MVMLYGKGKKKITVLRVLVIDNRVDVIQELVTRCNRIRYDLSQRYNKELIYTATTIAQAQKKIKAGLNLQVIVFSQDFPEEKISELRRWLSFRQQAVPFFIVPVSLPGRVV